ncbi:NAD(P)/FAD-dependent oxidoreductase [cyanobiont of Ornithocercus magnificus]|nr:NAD(P)/FAD-dependent oxidoreductase [cyanobiont of Ornithocercus magnificus]
MQVMAASHPSPASVIVVGGGFAGLSTALSLRQHSPQPPVLLIEPRPRFLFLPLLYELLSGEMKAWEVAPAYSSLLSDCGISLIPARVTRIDTRDQIVTTEAGEEFHYEQLALATGSQPDDFGIPGVREHAIPFQSLEDVIRLRRCLREFKRTSDDSLVIVGAGPTGVELACKAADILRSRTEVHLIDLADRILPQGRAFNRSQAEAALKQRRVRIHLHTQVAAVQADSVDLGAYGCLRHRGIVWTAGNRPAPPELVPSAPLESGKLAINSDLRIEGLNNVLALGDIARPRLSPWPATAQVAMQQGRAAAAAIIAMRCGEATAPFQFRDLGEMLSLGIGNATITGLGITLAGPLAFRLRRLIYAARMPGLTLGLRSTGSWLLSR